MLNLLKMTMNIEEVIDNFDFLEDWEDKYLYIIDLGKNLEDLDNRFKVETNLVEGCQSRVWLTSELQNNGETTIKFKADSDSQIVKGLISILLTIYSEKTPKDILSVDINSIFQKLELEEHLSTNRSNGLWSMVNKIKDTAQSYVN